MSHPFGSCLIPATTVLNGIIPPQAHLCPSLSPAACGVHVLLWLSLNQEPVVSLKFGRQCRLLTLRLTTLGGILNASQKSQWNPAPVVPSFCGSSSSLSHSCIPGSGPTTLLWGNPNVTESLENPCTKRNQTELKVKPDFSLI